MPVAGCIDDAWRQGPAGGDRERSCCDSPPGRATSSGRKFPVARALCRFSRFVHHPLPPLQLLAEALVELLMDHVREGDSQCWLILGLRPQPQYDCKCLLQEEKHFIYGGLDPVISQ